MFSDYRLPWQQSTWVLVRFRAPLHHSSSVSYGKSISGRCCWKGSRLHWSPAGSACRSLTLSWSLTLERKLRDYLHKSNICPKGEMSSHNWDEYIITSWRKVVLSTNLRVYYGTNRSIKGVVCSLKRTNYSLDRSLQDQISLSWTGWVTCHRYCV